MATVIAESAATNVMGNPWDFLLELTNHVVNVGHIWEPRNVVLTRPAPA